VIKELPPVNYLIQKSIRSKPIIAHVDKLKSWVTDNPPKSWLKSEDDASADLNTGSRQHRAGDDRADGSTTTSTGTGASLRTGERETDALSSGSLGTHALLRQREGDLTPSTFCSLEETCRDDHGGATPDAVNESRSGLVDYVVAVNTGNGDTNGQCRDDPESVVSNADRANGIVMTTAEVVDGGHPSLANDDTHVKVPYLSNGQSASAADDRNRLVIPGSSNEVMEGQSEPVGGVQQNIIPGSSNEVMEGQSESVGGVQQRVNPGMVDGVITDSEQRQRPTDGFAAMSPGMVNDGVGLGRYISGRDDGQSGMIDGDARIPGMADDGDGPGRYTSGREDRVRPCGSTLGHDDVEVRGRQRTTPRSSTDRAAEPSGSVISFGQFNDNADAAIAGDPHSVQRRRDHPHRAG